ncbi:MAG: PQQ-dependent sugar dehydrogenase [Flavobacteriales bacterium]|nr:PQQ-dependent sugar dehydrogenase [Flavobacteriales bacterium]
MNKALFLMGLVVAMLLPVQAFSQDTFTVGNTTLFATDLVSDSQIPWELVWGGDDMLWCSERKGRVIRIDPSSGDYTTVLDLNVTFNGSGEPGLLGMVQHPDFPEDPRVWVVYCNGQNSVSEHLSVFEWNGTELVNEQELLTLPGAQIHNGSRLLWLPDNTMLMTTGDAGDTDNSQDLESLNGKILRINPDGSIPEDNPFGPESYVYTWGNRNAQGLCIGPNGLIYASEHGQNQDDEFNLVEAGRNYGWPNVQGACNAPSETAFCQEWDVAEPLLAWTPCIALNGLEYYTHEAIPEFQGKIMMGVMSGFNDPLPGRLIMIELSEDGLTADSQEAFFGSFNQRIRDVAVNPYTGAFYLAFNGQSYPGNPPNIIKEFSTSGPSLVPTPVVKPLLIQPVPARNSASIFATDGAVGGPLVIRDMTGRVVFEGTVPSVQFDLDISGFSTGRYIVWTAIGAADLLVH